MSTPEISIDRVLEEMRTYMQVAPEVEKRIRKAYEYAREAHETKGIDPVTDELIGKPQLRRSGEPYIIHPLETALILAQFRMDPDSIIVGLLHDVIEDTVVTEKDLEKEFGTQIAKLCSGLAKLSKVRYKGEDRQVENLKRMLVTMAEDVRIILVKLADRLHNMRTLEYVRIDKRGRIAKETLEIYAPLAYRLGVFPIKAELENLCFKYLYPVDYLEITSRLKKQSKKDEIYIEKVRQELLKVMGAEGISGRVEGRVKHPYSIFAKMRKKGLTFEEIYDRIALRVVVPTKKDCYALLGALHSKWQMMIGRFKDYIALPKINGYQSLHTVVYPLKGKDRQPTEIQIRTDKMHQQAEYGIAAHWLYAEKGKDAKAISERQERWIKALAQIQKDIKNADVSESLRMDFLESRIFVFTPFGDIVDLPRGATPVDFAFAVHTEVGLTCQAAQVDGRIVPLDYNLRSGQTVKITSKKNATPSRYWLSFVKTSMARNKIKQYFRAQDYDKNLAAGREQLKKEMDRHGFKLDKKDVEKRALAIKGTPYKTFDDLLVAIGNASHSVIATMNAMFPEEFRTLEPQRGFFEKMLSSKKEEAREIVVEGVSGMPIELKACCKDSLGDHIVGYITRGKGIAIHRADCRAIRNVDPARLVAAYFRGKKYMYPVRVAVFVSKRAGVFRRAIEIFDSKGINLTQASFFTEAQMEKYNPPEGTNRVLIFDFKIGSLTRLQGIFDELERISGVIGIARLSK